MDSSAVADTNNDSTMRRRGIRSETVKSQQQEVTDNDRPSLFSSPSSSVGSLSTLIKDPTSDTSSSLSMSKTSKTTTVTMKKTIEKKNFESLKERSKSPPSLYISLFLIISVQYFNGFYFQLPQVKESLQRSLSISASTFVSLVQYSASLLFLGKCEEAGGEENTSDFVQRYIRVFAVTALVSSIVYILVYAPLKAGMWTNSHRVKKHKIHRYFGLSFLILYGLAWIEFLNDYDTSYRESFLPVIISLNGLVQVHSAYFSFKVLPNLEDAGFFSDIAVLSRTFVHENSFYQLMTYFGSVYYGPSILQFSHLQAGQGGVLKLISTTVEYVFIFYPYVVLRPFFPTTRFQDAGKGASGRTKRNEKFYEIGTTAIKIFYLWSKYFLGFYINFLMFIHFRRDNDNGSGSDGGSVSISYDDMKFIRGLFLLNVGTVSIAVFLHTLRFKKVLPPRLTFSFYMVQIYLTFSAVPYLGHLFSQNYNLLGLVLLGMACNMTRSRKIHALWCVMCHYLLVHSDIQW